MTGPLLDFDRTLKERGINPGTSADLTVATLLVYRLQSRMPVVSSVTGPSSRASSGGDAGNYQSWKPPVLSEKHSNGGSEHGNNKQSLCR